MAPNDAPLLDQVYTPWDLDAMLCKGQAQGFVVLVRNLFLILFVFRNCHVWRGQLLVREDRFDEQLCPAAALRQRDHGATTCPLDVFV